jgi:hypothetical protein
VKRYPCPRPGCSRTVSASLFCCLGDWEALDDGTRQGISKTAGLSSLSTPRQAAIKEAKRQWDGSVTRNATRYTRGDRSPECREAHMVNSRAIRDRARRRAQEDPSLVPHGTLSGYTYWACRCAACRARMARPKS